MGMSERLRPEQRLRRESHFQTVFEKGKSFRGPFLNLWVCASSELKIPGAADDPKLGLIVSRKTDLKATRRNLWKRRMREAFRRQQNQIVHGITVVIISKRQKKVPSYGVIFGEINNLLREAGALKLPPGYQP